MPVTNGVNLAWPISPATGRTSCSYAGGANAHVPASPPDLSIRVWDSRLKARRDLVRTLRDRSVGKEWAVAVAEDTRDLRRLADLDPNSILDRLNENITRKMPTYRELYRRWERLNWEVSDLDFSQDVEDWRGLDAEYQERLLWTLAAFYVAEQRVTATLTPYVAAAPRTDQKIFLATQCVDEARHTVFFDRWFDEVVAAGDGDLALRLRSSRQWVGPGFAPLFDEYLEEVTSQLRQNPRDIRLFAKAMSVYHLVIEGVLALTGQKFILAWARDNGILPGFRAGFTAVARDESRHVAFGARVIRDLLQEDPSLIEPIHDGAREALRLGTALYQPPNGDVTYTTVFGYSLADLFNYGGVQMEKKARAIGMPMPKVDVFVPSIDADWPPPGGGLVPLDFRQRTTTSLMRGLGLVAPNFAPGLAVMMLYLGFDSAAAKDVHCVYEFDLSGRGGGVYTCEIDDGECRIHVGRVDRDPDVVYEMDASTWLAMTQGRATGDEGVLLGKIRVRGDISLGRRFNEFFAPQGEAAVTLAAEEHAYDAGRSKRANGLVDRVLRRTRAA
jgi:ribonucleoside-diphosphate reductase beta chain